MALRSLVFSKPLSLEVFEEEPVYYLNQVMPRFRYLDGKRTDECLGYVYTVTNTETYLQIQIFVEQAQPLITPEELEELHLEGKKIFVEFIDATVRPYYSERTKTIEDSIKARDVKQVVN